MMTVTSPPAPPEIKLKLRQDALRRRSSAHSRLKAGAGEIVRGLGLELIGQLPGGIVSGYFPIRDEIDPVPLLTGLIESGRQIALPVLVAKATPLIFRSWKPGETLETKTFGLREPLPSVPAVLPDILLVPVAAFDSAGFRIGYGGGYYDRTLDLYHRTNRKITAIGLAYDEQEVPQFPHEPHDQRLDYLITPTGVRRFGA
jgi:5-formyltetrahydrofolate cyclo-ligase